MGHDPRGARRSTRGRLNIFGFVRKLFTRKTVEVQQLRPAARYDAAGSGEDNAAHWAAADLLSPNAANSPSVRETVRKRARYEEANNSYLRALIRQIANDMIGTGPRLQLRIEDRKAARRVERAFRRWSKSVCLADKLRLMHRTMLRDGESFGVLTNNPVLNPVGIQLDLRLYEADQIATPNLFMESDKAVDGITFDRYGNPEFYHLLKAHPGSLGLFMNSWDYDKIPAKSMLHWFDRDRAGQARGVPHIMSALPLFAQLRRYTLATIGAAELGASIAAVMSTNLPPPGTSQDSGSGTTDREAMQRINFERIKMLTLPEGWAATSFNSKQPVDTYPGFKGEIIDESGRSLGAPANISRGTSRDMNYSSGRLDHVPYQHGLKIERNRLQSQSLDRILAVWLDEATYVPGLLDGLPSFAEMDWDWQWDGFGSIDPVKDRTARKMGLQSFQANLDDVLNEDGVDWEEFLQKRAEQAARCKELGLPDPFIPDIIQQAQIFDTDPQSGAPNRAVPEEEVYE